MKIVKSDDGEVFTDMDWDIKTWNNYQKQRAYLQRLLSTREISKKLFPSIDKYWAKAYDAESFTELARLVKVKGAPAPRYAFNNMQEKLENADIQLPKQRN